MQENETSADITITYHNDTYARVIADPSIKMEIGDYFCFEVENARHHPKVKGGIWDGLIRLFATRTGDLPAGLVPNLVNWGKKNGYTIEDQTVPPSSINNDEFETWLESLQIFSKGKPIKPHWYQKDAVRSILDSRRALIQLPTSAGKSLVIGLFSRYFFDHHNPGKVLVIVPTVSLVRQMKDDLVDYRLFDFDDILCIKSGTERDSNAKIYVSTWQTACKQPPEWYSQFNALLTDEVHLGTGKTLSEICQGLTDCKYKTGLTGTLKDAKASLMQLIGLYGQVFKPTTTKQLMNDGQITELDIKPLHLTYPKVDLKKLGKLTYPNEIKWLITNKERNRFLARLAAASPEMNTIILFKQLTHGKELFRLINNLVAGTNRNVHYIAGEVKDTVREELRHIIENDKGAIIVASYGTMSTGVSINNLHRAISAHPVKSKIINLQSIGRILRKHESKSKAQWFDLIDDLRIGNRRNFAYEHALVRLRLYAREGFNFTIKKVSL